MEKKSKLPLIIAGGLAGLCNGFFGAGGGTLVVPALQRWGKLEQHKAHATAIVIILPLAVITLGLYWWRGLLDGDILRRTLPVALGGLIGGFFGGKLLPHLSEKWLRGIFSVFMALAGLQLIFRK